MKRLFLLCLLLLLATAAQAGPIRIGLTPVILDEQVRFLERWRLYLEQATGHEVQFVRRNSYSEIVDLALRGRLDFAWLCGYSYVSQDRALEILAVPLFQGEPSYQAYLIVPASNTDATELADLENGIFAFSDPNSNSGWLYPERQLRELNTSSERFFARGFFTSGHRRVIEAVAHGLADGGSVDSYVWETLARDKPQLVADTRVIGRSPEFGFPPIVATPAASDAAREALQAALFAMNEHPEGRGILQQLNLDGFIAGGDSLYDSIRALADQVSSGP